MRVFLLCSLLLLGTPALLAANTIEDYDRQARTLLEKTLQQTEVSDNITARDLLQQSIEQADTLLNAAYTQVMKKLQQKDPGLAEELRAEQRAWLRFAEKMYTAVGDGFGEGGTMYIGFGQRAQLRLWVERIGHLHLINRYLND